MIGKPVQAQEDILHQVGGGLRIAGNHQRGAVNHALVLVIEQPEGIQAALLELDDQVLIDKIHPAELDRIFCLLS